MYELFALILTVLSIAFIVVVQLSCFPVTENTSHLRSNPRIDLHMLGAGCLTSGSYTDCAFPPISDCLSFSDRQEFDERARLNISEKWSKTWNAWKADN